jgi:hypothetical protein
MAIASPFNMLLNGAGETRIQVLAWATFLLITLSLKYELASAQNLWVVPTIGAAAYLFVILPSAVYRARKMFNA